MGSFLEAMSALNNAYKANELNRQKTIAGELSNKPRYDIDGRRYGNTLTDDMLSIKGGKNHAPESYGYWNEESVPQQPTEYGAVRPDYTSEGLVSRKKFYGEGKGIGNVYDGLLDREMLEDDTYLPYDTLTALLDRRDKNMANDRVQDLSTEAMQNEKFGRAVDDMYPRFDAERDPYLDALINYQALSPATVGMLYQMGVNRPDDGVAGIENASETLNGLISLYKFAVENGLR